MCNSSWEKQKPWVELTQNRIMKKFKMGTTIVNCGKSRVMMNSHWHKYYYAELRNLGYMEWYHINESKYGQAGSGHSK